MKIFLTGERNIGKTTLINRVVEGLPFVPVGFQTALVDGGAEGDRFVIIPYGADPVSAEASSHTVATRCKGRSKPKSNPSVFDTIGTQTLRSARESKEAGLIIMDELGFFENDAHAFQDEVLRCLDTGIPVLGVVKPAQQRTPFLEKVCAHKDVRVIEVTLQNREALYLEVRDELFSVLGL